MVLNKTNAKTIASLYGNHVEAWPGKRITIYVQKNVRAFGSVTDALRIKDYKPKDNVDVAKCIELLDQSTTLEELKANFMSLNKSEKGHPEVDNFKNQLKKQLSNEH